MPAGQIRLWRARITQQTQDLPPSMCSTHVCGNEDRCWRRERWGDRYRPQERKLSPFQASSSAHLVQFQGVVTGLGEKKARVRAPREVGDCPKAGDGGPQTPKPGGWIGALIPSSALEDQKELQGFLGILVPGPVGNERWSLGKASSELWVTGLGSLWGSRGLGTSNFWRRLQLSASATGTL